MRWLAARHVVVDGTVAPASIAIENGWITEVRGGVRAGADLVDGHLLPGYVDTHCHGAAGASFTDPDAASVRRAIAHHRAHGSTTLFASTVTETIEDLVVQLGRLRPLVDAGELAGVHLEGPFLAPARKGAHSPGLLRDPDPASIDALVRAGGTALRMVTLAPEYPSGQAAIRTLAALGIAPAFGHSDADAATARGAVDAGVSVVTHLFNAMRPIHHREPGPVPWLLTDPRVVIELICDGLHLDPDIIRMAVRTAGPQRVALVTDAMAATGQPDGDYALGPLTVRVGNGAARILHPDGSLGAIAGSTLTMAAAVRFVVGTVGLSLADASCMASTVPARTHGLAQVGRIAPDQRADLCVTDEGGTLLRVLYRGQWVSTGEGDQP